MEIEVYLERAVFRGFSVFDILRRRKLWRSPVLFALILGFFACICFLMRQIDGAVMLGWVLLIVGVGLPCAYFLNFFLSLNKQTAGNGPRLVYTLNLTEAAKGICVRNGSERAAYGWADVYHAYRDTLAAYLYITPDRAFILPYACAKEGADALWAFLCRMLPQEKCTDLRKRK